MARCKHHEELGYGNVDCMTCKSLTYHESIFGGLSLKERLELYKTRTKMAFGN